MATDSKLMAVVRTRFQFMHNWPNAPAGKHEHLRNRHRHEFHVELLVEQHHDDRDLEYLALKDALDEQLAQFVTSEFKEYFSCEMMAVEIARWMTVTYGERSMTVEVNEDGENGAVLIFQA